MKQQKTYIQCIAIVIGLVLLLPYTIQFQHVVANHEHTICIDVKNVHFHELDVECDMYDFTINHNTTFNGLDFDFLISLSNYKTSILKDSIFSGVFTTYFSLRAPPLTA